MEIPVYIPIVCLIKQIPGNVEYVVFTVQIILLQEESRKTLEARIKYTALLEENKAKEAELTVAKSRIEDLQKEHDEDRGKLEEILKLREDDRKTIEDLQRERDDAQAEAQSFKRSIFGFYRKR